MIHVIAKSTVKPEHINAYKSIVLQLVADTNAKDSGCIQYELFQDIKNPEVFTMIETWNSMEDLKGHMSAEHLISAGEATKDFMTGESDVTLYQKVTD